MWQYYSLEDRLTHPLYVGDELCSFATFGDLEDTLPRGLLGLDMETGLVEVAISKDKTISMKFGKLLSKLNVPEAKIPDYAARMSAIHKEYSGARLNYACTEEEILYVYQQGPNSCMSSSNSVRAYATDSIKVAFVEVGDRIVARTVLNYSNEENVEYSHIYGDEELMKRLLLKAGYSEGSLNGCWLKKIEDDYGNVYCPYLDCNTRVDIEGNT